MSVERRRPKRVVLFDFGNTLVDYWTADQTTALLMAGFQAARQELLTLRPGLTVGEPPTERPPDFRGDPADYRVLPLVDRLARTFDVEPATLSPTEWHVVSRALLAPFCATAQPLPDALPTLEALRYGGYALGIFSNSPWGAPADLWRAEIERYIPPGLVEYIGVCGDCGWRKPAPEAFGHALLYFGTSAEECLFVGDHVVWDVEGALAVGMDAVLFDPHDRHVDTPYQRIQTLSALLPLLLPSQRLDRIRR